MAAEAPWIPSQTDHGTVSGLSEGPLFQDQGPGESLADVCDNLAASPDDLDSELADLLNTAEHPPVITDAPVPAPASHRKTTGCPPSAREGGRRNWSWQRLLSVVSVLLTTMIVAAVGILGAMASYPALSSLASGAAPANIAALWPLLVYGPWIAAILSILRARAYRRRTAHSWAVIILFAVIAMALCIFHAPTTPAGITVAGLPPVTVLLCFHQLVRQLDLVVSPAPVPTTRHAHSSRGAHRQRVVR